jgi:hypothetical protein
MRVAFDCVSSGSIEKEKAMKRLALLTAAAGFLVALTSARPALSDSAALVEENSATTIVLAQAEGKKKERRGEERRGEERRGNSAADYRIIMGRWEFPTRSGRRSTGFNWAIASSAKR